jgi:hypothetical protein
MDDEDIRHSQTLIVENTRHLRVLEQQAAAYGKLACPPHIVIGIEDATRQIKELEQRIRRRIRHADDGTVLYNLKRLTKSMKRYQRLLD